MTWEHVPEGKGEYRLGKWHASDDGLDLHVESWSMPQGDVTFPCYRWHAYINNAKIALQVYCSNIHPTPESAQAECEAWVEHIIKHAKGEA
jgi:hypothetical protein